MSSDTLLREVDEELRRDRIRKLWRQAAPWVIGAAVAVVVGVAGYEGWNWWQSSQSSAASDQFYAATELADGADLAAAQASLDAIIAQGSTGYAVLARFREAALLAQQDKIDEAIAAYDATSSSVANTHLRELALVLGANLLVDRGDVDAVQQRVGGLLNPDSTMRNAAREVLGLTQYKAGRLDEALASLQAILDDPAVSEDTRGRIQLYTVQLLSEGAKAPVVEVAEEAEAAPASAAAPAAPSAAPLASAEPSAAVDASTELAVTPPASSAASSSAVEASSVAP